MSSWRVLKALHGAELWTTVLLYLAESAENLDLLSINLSAPNKNIYMNINIYITADVQTRASLELPCLFCVKL